MLDIHGLARRMNVQWLRVKCTDDFCRENVLDSVFNWQKKDPSRPLEWILGLEPLWVSRLKGLKGKWWDNTSHSQVVVSKKCYPGMCLHWPGRGREAIFILQCLVPYMSMSRKLLEKITGSEIMNGSDRFQTKRHASCTGHWFYTKHSRYLRSLYLMEHWVKIRREMQGVEILKSRCMSKQPKYTTPPPLFLLSEPLHSAKFTFYVHELSLNGVKQTSPEFLPQTRFPSCLPGFLAHSLPLHLS